MLLTYLIDGVNPDAIGNGGSGQGRRAELLWCRGCILEDEC